MDATVTDMITTPGELVDCIFQELDEFEPRQNVHSTFVVRMAGICHGIGYGTCSGEPPYLSTVLATPHNELGICGVKLVALAEALEAEGCFDPSQALTVNRLIRLMLAALDSPDIELRTDQKTGQYVVVSDRAYEQRRGCKIRVLLNEV
jgi:hypothetical protein